MARYHSYSRICKDKKSENSHSTVSNQQTTTSHSDPFDPFVNSSWHFKIFDEDSHPCIYGKYTTAGTMYDTLSDQSAGQGSVVNWDNFLDSRLGQREP